MKKLSVILMTMFMCGILSVNAQVESGLPVPVALQNEISTKFVKEGDMIPFLVTSEVYDNEGELIIPEGTIAYGSVVKKKVRKIFGKGAALEIGIDHVALADGTKIPLYADNLLTQGKDNKLTKILGITGCFYLVGFPFIFVKGKHAIFEAGTVMQAYTK